MKSIIRILWWVTFLGACCTIKTAEQHEPPVPEHPGDGPVFIQLSSLDLSEAINSMGETLLDSLGIRLPMPHPVPSTEEVGERQMAETEEEAEFKGLEKGNITFQVDNYGNVPANQLTRKLLSLKNEDRPVIILCEGKNTQKLQETLLHAPDNSVHTVILLNPSVYKPINYNAISHRMYNFYSKTGTFWGLGGAAAERKYYPGQNDPDANGIGGFDPTAGWSKIVNIHCSQQTGPTIIEQEFSSQDIARMDIPGMIRLADQQFHLNWDLNAETTRPVVSIRRKLELDLPRKALTHTSEGLIRTAADWTYKLDDANIARINAQLNKEYADSQEAVPGSMSTVQGTALFVPDSNHAGTDLVVFIRSIIPRDLDKNNIELISGGQMLHPSHFIVLGKQGEIGRWTSVKTWLPYLKNLVNDPYYYAIAKFAIQSVNGQSFEVHFKHEPLYTMLGEPNKGLMPIVPTKDPLSFDFDFVAFADVQKQNQQYPLYQGLSGSSVYQLAEIVSINESIAQKEDGSLPNSLYLVVGDLVRNGKNWNSWNEILSKLTSIVSDQNMRRFGLLATAIGTHDFADVDWGLLTYPDYLLPTYGYLFNFNPVNDLPVHIDPQDHVNRTAMWFDVGRVRFIHLPYTTEEEFNPEPDEGVDLNKVENLHHKESKVHPFGFNPDKILAEFKLHLDLAVQARDHKDIDFIVIYGHAPLATAPQYKHLHPGLFNSLAADDFKTSYKKDFAEKLFNVLAHARIDLYLSGHNHQFDHCEITYVLNDPQKGELIGRFPAITVGLGTELRRAMPNNSQATLDGRVENGVFSIISEKFLSRTDAKQYAEYFVGKFMPAYLKCQVRGHRMTCTLMGKDGILRNKGAGRGGEPFDFFQIKSHNLAK